MKRISLLLMFFLFISCVGQHRTNQQISYSHPKNSDCKTLLKKQKLQYNLAIREGKANQRRRKTAVVTVQKNEVTTDKGLPGSAYQQKNISLNVASPHLFTQGQSIENIDLFVPIIPAVGAPLTSTRRNSHGPQLQKKTNKSNIKEDVGRSNFISSSLPVVLLGLAGIGGMGLLKLFEKKGRQISRFGQKNPWKIRGYIGATQIVMGLASLWLGYSLYNEGIMIPEYARLSTLCLFAVAAIFYPSGNYANGFPTFSYLQRKFHDAALFTTGAMLTVYAGNHCHITLQPTDARPTFAHISMHEEKIFSVKFATHKISIVKNDFQARLKTHFEDPKKSRTQGEKIALTIIVSLGFALLTAGVAAASCSLSCSGNEVAAVAVLIGGAALIVWGLSTALKSIHRYPTREKRPKVQQSA